MSELEENGADLPEPAPAEPPKKPAKVALKKYPPTAEELRRWMDAKGLSNKDVAKALRLSDGRVVRFWTSKKNPRVIPYPSWYTLKHKFRNK